MLRYFDLAQRQRSRCMAMYSNNIITGRKCSNGYQCWCTDGIVGIPFSVDWQRVYNDILSELLDGWKFGMHEDCGLLETIVCMDALSI